MSDNSIESLLQWMANPASNVMWGWDCIAAMNRDKTNLLLAQVYIARFDSGSYLPPISGDLEVTGSFKHYMHDFLMDIPVLSFADADLDNSKAKLSMSVMGGTHVKMNKLDATWEIDAIRDIDPLEGPRLYLDLELDKVPGTVGQDGQVRLDLKYSDDFVMTLGYTKNEQELIGQFFKERFNDLDNEQRVYVLGSIEPGGDPQMRPQSFRLRTQARGGDDSTGDGAILVLIRLVGGTEGSIPGPSLRYLIPDGSAYSATVLLEWQHVARQVDLVQAVLDQATQLFVGARFTPTTGPDGRLASAVANAGTIKFDSVLQGAGPFLVLSVPVVLRLFFTGMEFLANSRVPFSIRLDPDGLRVRVAWEWEGTCTRFSEIVPPRGFDFKRTFQRRDYRIRLDIVYQMKGQGTDLVLVPAHFDLDEYWDEVDWSEDMVSDTDIDGSNPRPGHEIQWEILKFIEAYGSPQVRPSIRSRLEKQLGLASLGSFISDTIKLNFSQAILSDTLHVPRDIGVFGRVSPISTTFVIDPLEPRVIAGGSQQFKTFPAVTGVQWSVQALDDQGTAGTITATGLYRAPAASSFKGRFTRVRVTARKADFHSSALVSVMRNPMTVNPLIETCNVGGRYALGAGQLGEGELEWSIVDPVPGQSGTLVPSSEPDIDYFYVAVSEEDKTPGLIYAVDRIRVRNKTSGQALTVVALVELGSAVLNIRIAEDALPDGKLKLLPFVGNEELDQDEWPMRWSLPLDGPGSLSESGIYSPDETTLERFVLVMVQSVQFESFMGHLILPLPLAAFPDECALLSAS